jgi:RecB family endonuclease NucS
LTDGDVKVLLKAIKSAEQKPSAEAILSTGEVTEVIEKDIEAFIERNPSLLGKSLKLEARQFDTEVGKIDLLFRSKAGYLVVEIKLHKIGRDAISQLRRYMSWVKKNNRGQVKGAIVCEGVMPAFQEDFKKLKNIKIYCYGWQLQVCRWSGTG